MLATDIGTAPAAMLYRALVRFLGLVARTFYRRIEVVGLEHVPARGGVIFAGNHPNALIDGLVLISQAGRAPVHFLGNAKLWRIPLLARLLDMLGAVPVLRREEHGRDADNRGAFEAAYEAHYGRTVPGLAANPASIASSALYHSWAWACRRRKRHGGRW